MQRSWILVKQEKYLCTNFLKLKYVLLWPMVNFCLKLAQIWDLSSGIQGFEVIAQRPQTLESQMTDLKFELLLGRNWT